MFGFLVFWAYISFSEFFLIWYAAIPEEVVYFHRRWNDPSWRMISIAIVVLKFIVPFYVSMSRNAKRNNGIIGFAAGWLLAMHTVEMYYWIMPYYAPFQGVQWSGIWLEAGCVMATIGIYLPAVFLRCESTASCVGYPRLARAQTSNSLVRPPLGLRRFSVTLNCLQIAGLAEHRLLRAAAVQH